MKQVRYKLSRPLVLTMEPDGDFLASTVVSSRPVSTGLSGLAMLQIFIHPTTPGNAYTQLVAETGPVERGDFDRALADFIAQRVLVPLDPKESEAGEPRASLPQGFASPTEHHYMLRDTARVMLYRAAIFAHSAGKTVLDIGCGSGILSTFAAQAGATQVYAIEQTGIAEVAREVFEKNGVADRVQLFVDNSLNVLLPARCDVIVHEILGTDPLAESMLETIRDARERLLAPGGRLIPWKIEICAVALERNEPLDKKRRIAAEVRNLAAMYGVNLDPLADNYDISRKQRLKASKLAEQNSGRYLSDEVVLRSIDLMTDPLLSSYAPEPFSLPIHTDGHVNALILFFRAYLDEHTVLSTSPLNVATHWGHDLVSFPERRRVRAGEELRLFSEIRKVGRADGSQNFVVGWS